MFLQRACDQEVRRCVRHPPPTARSLSRRARATMTGWRPRCVASGFCRVLLNGGVQVRRTCRHGRGQLSRRGRDACRTHVNTYCCCPAVLEGSSGPARRGGETIRKAERQSSRGSAPDSPPSITPAAFSVPSFSPPSLPLARGASAPFLRAQAGFQTPDAIRGRPPAVPRAATTQRSGHVTAPRPRRPLPPARAHGARGGEGWQAARAGDPPEPPPRCAPGRANGRANAYRSHACHIRQALPGGRESSSLREASFATAPLAVARTIHRRSSCRGGT